MVEEVVAEAAEEGQGLVVGLVVAPAPAVVAALEPMALLACWAA